MIRILFFFGLIFGLFGVCISQYLGQYREAYLIWIQKMVYDVNTDPDCNVDKCNKKLCGQIESYSRELCTLTDTMYVLFIGVCFTYLAVVVSTYSYFRPILIPIYNCSFCKVTVNTSSFNQSISCFCVTNSISSHDWIIQICSTLIASGMFFYGVPRILRASHVDIFNVNKSSAINRLLFDVWYKSKCFKLKTGRYRHNLKPNQLYHTLARKYENKEKVDGEVVDIPDDIIKVMKEHGGFFKTDVYNNP